MVETSKDVMKTIKKLFLFFFCNWLGFTMPAIIYNLATLKFNLIDFENESFDALSFYSNMSGDTPAPVMVFEPTVTWIICALFSFAIFFLKGKWRYVFMLAPIVMPTLHSLILLIKFM